MVNYEDDVNFALKLVLEGQIERGETATNRKCLKMDAFSNPISSLKSFKKRVYDLAIIGVMIPKINGFELARELRRIDDDLKVCFLTAGEIRIKLSRYKMSYTQYTDHQDKVINLPLEN